MNFRAEKDAATIAAAMASPPAAAEPEAATPSAKPASGGRGVNVRPLAALLPYVRRYRGRALAALGALILAALTTLTVPVAVRRMIDFGFTARGLALIDSYFLVMIGVAAVLSLSSALRYYLVTTLGERVVADLRSDVFAHLTSLSPAFFDEARTGEVISRLTADTTQVKAAAGTSVSVALRNFVLFVGAGVMMVASSPRLSAFVLAAIPLIVLPLYAFGRAVRRRSRYAQDTLADASAYAAELIGAVRVLQAFTNERLGVARFRDAVERAFSAARDSIRARALLTGIAIFLVAASVVIVLWIGAQDVLAAKMTPGRLGQFILYAVLAADFRERAERAAGKHRIEDELSETSRCDLAGQHLLGSDPQHDDDARGHQEDGDTGEESPRTYRVARGVISALDGLAKPADAEALGGERLQHAHRADQFGGVGGRLRERILRRTRAAAHGAAESVKRQHDDRDRGEHEGGKPWARHHHHHGRADKQHEIAQRDRNGCACRRLDLCRIRGKARDDFAGSRFVEKGARQRGDVCEHVAAQIGDNAFAERRDEVVAKGACGRQHRRNADHDQKIAVDEGDALGRKAKVHHAPNGDRHDQRRQRGNNQGAKRRQCAPAVAPDIG